jgi:lysophospholipase L1-like esterase
MECVRSYCANGRWSLLIIALTVGASLLTPSAGATDQMSDRESWITVWTGSIQGPFPIGTAPPQPQLNSAFLAADVKARNQTFRMIVRPSFFRKAARLRFSNWASSSAVILDDVFVGIQKDGPNLVTGTNHPVLFGGQTRLVVPAGASIWSDPIDLNLVPDENAKPLIEQKFAISFHVEGEASQMSWKSEAIATSYVSPFDSGSFGSDEGGDHYSVQTSSSFFVDAVDMLATRDVQLIVALGDSITNGTGSTLDSDDKWTDQLWLRLRQVYGAEVAVVNAGIGGNQVTSPSLYSKSAPFPGGPSAVQRLDRDVLSLSRVSTVIWTEGINDLADRTASPEAIFSAIRLGVSKIRAQIPGVRVLLGTLITALGSAGNHGTEEVDKNRRRLNDLIRSSDFVDGVIDFDSAIIDSSTGKLKPGYATEDVGGAIGDRLHPSPAGYRAMVGAINLEDVMGVKAP